ncbi:MAG: molybdopterin molybdenumtransferase MoeA [Eggerthellaceae bacterium]|nr:molybdopterin molybdenumtransferase MoeA [Eggerthellaceae bacterium]
MLEVVSLEDARSIVRNRFSLSMTKKETIPAEKACGRAIADDVIAREGVPPFDRSTVDGYAVHASDTFGCSDALPAILTLVGEVEMGAKPQTTCAEGACVRIPTGGQIPDGADAVVMLEYCEDYGDGTIGVAKSAAPGANVVYENDDVKPGEVLIPAKTVLKPHHIGTLASLGIVDCSVYCVPRVGIISTGDEIVDASRTPVAAQMRDVNAPTIAAAVSECDALPVRYPIVADKYEDLLETVREALETCDIVIVSGGSSAGQKDNTARVLACLGEMLFHGIAVKPGKPTLCADVEGKPVFGLPGHPVAAYFAFIELVKPLLVNHCDSLTEQTVTAVLSEGIPSNHGRAELVAVRLAQREGDLSAIPIRGKSGLISQLASSSGYVIVDRNCEGLAAGEIVKVKLFD